jgi:hypothetical protein
MSSFIEHEASIPILVADFDDGLDCYWFLRLQEHRTGK